MLAWISAHDSEVWSAAIALVGGVIARIMRMRPKLLYSSPHSTFLLNDFSAAGSDGNEVVTRQQFKSATIFFQNTGLMPVKEFEVTFNWKPQILNLTPPRAYEASVGDLGRYTMKFPSLSPSEPLTIDIVAINADLPLLASVRSENATAKLITMAPQRVWPSPVLWVVALSMFLGAATAIYLTVEGVQLIAEHAVATVTAPKKV